MRSAARVGLAGCLLLAAVGCSDDPPSSPPDQSEVETPWQLEVESGSRDWLSFRKIPDGWAALTVRHFRVLGEDFGTGFTKDLNRYYLYLEPVIGERFHAFITESGGRGITIGSNDLLTLPLVFSSLDQLDPRLSSDCQILGGTFGPFGALSDDGALVFASLDWGSSPEGIPPQRWIYRLQIDVAASQESGYVGLSGWERFPAPGEPGESSPVIVSWLGGNDFLVSTMQASYRLGSDGTMARVMDERVGSVLRLPGRLLAAGRKLRESTDGGRTWVEHEGFDGISRGLSLFVAGDELFGWHGSGIVWLRPDAEAHWLDHQGIYWNIVGIHATEDYFYVGTGEGLYSKSIESIEGP